MSQAKLVARIVGRVRLAVVLGAGVEFGTVIAVAVVAAIVQRWRRGEPVP